MLIRKSKINDSNFVRKNERNNKNWRNGSYDITSSN